MLEMNLDVAVVEVKWLTMLKRNFLIALCVIVGWSLAASAMAAEAVRIEIDVASPSHAISPRLYGVFFEDINFGSDGGLYAELVKNGAFEFPDPLMGWTRLRGGGSGGEIQVANDKPVSDSNPHYLRIDAEESGEDFGVENAGYRGMGVREGNRYLFSAQVRTKESTPGSLQIALVDENGDQIAAAQIDGITNEWSEKRVALVPNRTVQKARLALICAMPGTVNLDLVSLCPEKTWKGRPHGLRADLVQLLSDLKPSFVRFPGGCIVEGSELKTRYQWKTTIGDLVDRQLIINRWNKEFAHRLTPDYFQSFGVGFFEFFQLADDLGAEPMPILNCGMACQFNSGQLAPLDELDPYIDDALDLIEFANGPADSPWGARRAEMGHPAPFDLKMLGVGNEQWGGEYFDRYERFAAVLSEKHPDIELISGSGPFPSDERFRYAWGRLRGLEAQVVDEHCYAMPDWFLRAATRYDSYSRSGPKVFMGEFAAQSVDICSPDNRNNLRCALAEAAFLTGIERNSDVVVMSSYAPLLAHEDAWQWRPDLIWFDNLDAYATPNYYVQQLFSLHRGDVVLPVELNDPRPPDPAEGRIGLATERASAEFKELRVTRNGETLYDSASPLGEKGTTTFRGRWEARDGVVRQSDLNATGRIQFGDPAWRDYTLSMKARKTAGGGGLSVIVRNSRGGSYIQWNLGGPQNNNFTVQANIATHSEDKTTVSRVKGTIEPNRWYDVRVELEGDHLRCYLDGKLVHDLEIPPPALPRLYAAASRDDHSGEVILKVVNAADEDAEIDVVLRGVSKVESPADVIVLHGKPDDENTLANPDRIVPMSHKIEAGAPQFRQKLRPYSLTIMRLNVE